MPATQDIQGDAIKVEQAYSDYHSSIFTNGIPGGPASQKVSKSLAQAVIKEIGKEVREVVVNEVKENVVSKTKRTANKLEPNKKDAKADHSTFERDNNGDV
ncbi:hypothetical protein FAZ15_16040 [Sphingobacterium olei]|uniref:Uncharacterized protein n=1 Tax=Sphingobacterium olei TaxID=2571155 RepID=A0A4U0NH93_9SPHI|nr:hypothetical protein [Sphingobacterium olei]TJZ53556.1 hypothetical protein FAZ15_16040 [Sphingobacterium olei]